MRKRVYKNWPISLYPIEEFKRRFWEKVDIAGPDECWLWNGARWDKKLGYGRVQFMFRRQKAHRVAFWIDRGFIDDKLMVCHKCNTPACVNPKHLYLGTCLDNQADSWKRGTRQSAILGRKGDMSPNHKLTSDNVAEAKSLKSLGWTQAAIAKRFGVTQGAISRMISGESW